jgi:hypothetical protein
MKKVVLIFVVSLFFVLAHAGSVHAEKISLTADAPVWNLGQYADTNFDRYGKNDPRWSQWANLDSELWTGSFYNTGNETRSYLSFAFSGDAAINSATLWMNVGNSEGSSNVKLYSVSPGSWEESVVTWNNQPRSDTYTYVSSANINGNGWYSWDVTSLAIGAGKDPVSVVLVADPKCSNGNVFYARETMTDFAPYVDVQAAPEPVASALFLLGGGLIVFMRRKK